jgi:predicted HD superfamily hydrolase involved in NAD metabolism
MVKHYSASLCGDNPTLDVTPDLVSAIRGELIARTPPHRLTHVLGVEGMAVVLAARHGGDTSRALLAALLHDLAKALPPNVQRERLDACTVVPPEEEDRHHPQVWHGFVGAQEAHDRYGITDTEVLEAVAYHPTGKAGLGQTGLVLFTADFLEPSRHWKGVEDIRGRLLAEPLLNAALEVAKLKMSHLAAAGKPLHSRTQDMASWLQTLLEKGTAQRA